MFGTETETFIAELAGKSIGGYLIGKYVDRGASALVFETEIDGQKHALKVFDPAFLEKFGKEQQTARIERQVALKGKQHENLIEIIDGGKCEDTGYYFLLMPFVDFPSLNHVLKKVPTDKILPIISQIANAARFLEEKHNLVHRDIKPANIATDSSFSKAILLDLGVVRPIGLSDVTDSTDTKQFVGTTRYSPPEFLLRYEDGSVDEWRAITFYQLGAVLHDLITKRLLFDGKDEPYGRLVRAVLLEDPEVKNDSIPESLIRLAKGCLVKDPLKRLKLVDWDSFSLSAKELPDRSSILERIRKLKEARDSQTEMTNITTDCLDRIRTRLDSVVGQLRQSCISDAQVFPPCSCDPAIVKSNIARAGISFRASPDRHGIDTNYVVIVDCEIIDVDTESVVVSMSIGVCDDEIADHDIDPDMRNVLYRGPVSGVSEDKMLTALYLATETVIEHCVVNGRRDNSSKSVQWLTLRGTSNE